MPSKLTQLRNIGNTSALWLQAIGVSDIHHLREVGAVDAYVRIQERGIKTSKVLLYAIHGALTDQHWNDIPADIKQELCDAAEKRLLTTDDA
ncbi:Uncharacterised protein [BD1-7 clade bacterium]|uniref:TfoX C-terminal domain-containing protein n=1 Tax=BD1-7 clade bacterium TaxID=2029982 RepID=A0A5S9NAK6_9GAMM|nr:Uncharacterised protein [BD1-7 clade bacterium]CAA0081844.1 Uncharacterised protein [BD1-7 clade bacterium]CAA0085189.1 Uncharacterised protein [BD1-7 clade bacterium]